MYQSHPASLLDVAEIISIFPEASPLFELPWQPIQVVTANGRIVGLMACFNCSNLTMAANGLDHKAVMAVAEPISLDKIVNVHIAVVFIEENHRGTEAFSVLYDGLRDSLRSLAMKGVRFGHMTATPGDSREAAAYAAFGLKPHNSESFVAISMGDFLGART